MCVLKTLCVDIAHFITAYFNFFFVSNIAPICTWFRLYCHGVSWPSFTVRPVDMSCSHAEGIGTSTSSSEFSESSSSTNPSSSCSSITLIISSPSSSSSAKPEPANIIDWLLCPVSRPQTLCGMWSDSFSGWLASTSCGCDPYKTISLATSLPWPGSYPLWSCTVFSSFGTGCTSAYGWILWSRQRLNRDNQCWLLSTGINSHLTFLQDLVHNA